MIKFIVIITVHFDAIRTCAFTHIVAEALILQPIYPPTATSKLQRLAYHICFQRIRKSRILELFFKVNLYAGTPGTVYGGMKLPDLLKSAEIGFHAFHQRIHLFKSAPVGQVGSGIKNYLFVAREIAALVHFLYKKTQTAAQSLVDNRFHRLFVCR